MAHYTEHKMYTYAIFNHRAHGVNPFSLYHHLHRPRSHRFLLPQPKLCPHEISTSSPPPVLLSVSLNVRALGTSISVEFCNAPCFVWLAYVTEHHVFRVCSCQSRCEDFLSAKVEGCSGVWLDHAWFIHSSVVASCAVSTLRLQGRARQEHGHTNTPSRPRFPFFGVCLLKWDHWIVS